MVTNYTKKEKEISFLISFFRYFVGVSGQISNLFWEDLGKIGNILLNSI